MKQAGKPSAGKPPAGFDAAGAGNRPTARLVRHSHRKRGATDRLSLRGNRRQSSTLLMSGEGKRAIGTAPLLDSTRVPGECVCGPPPSVGPTAGAAVQQTIVGNGQNERRPLDHDRRY